LGKLGRERVMENFTQVRVAEETHAVYQDIMSLRANAVRDNIAKE
jgi:hypothetical protein